jgi:hypothetical protein
MVQRSDHADYYILSRDGYPAFDYMAYFDGWTPHTRLQLVD